MANDDLKKRLEQRLQQQGSAGALPATSSTNVKYLLGQAAQTFQDRVQARQDTSMTVYAVFDSTGSMRQYIDQVRSCIDDVGRQVLDAKKGIEACVLGVNDHCDKQELVNARVKMLGDYGQDNTPTTNVATLQAQINGIINTSGGDYPEAYECLAADLVQKINTQKTATSSKKQVIILFGDDIPHNKKSNLDDGCPYQRGPEQLVAMTAVATHTYFVDCSESGDKFKNGTYQAAGNLQKTTYLRFEQARAVLPEAIIGMFKKEESPDALKEYLASLSADKASKVAGLLSRS